MKVQGQRHSLQVTVLSSSVKKLFFERFIAFPPIFLKGDFCLQGIWNDYIYGLFLYASAYQASL
jgi:hypothetical protein